MLIPAETRLGYHDKRIQYGRNVLVGDNVKINVRDVFRIGAGSVINDNVEIKGTNVEIGRETWIAEYASIGGGGCFDRRSHFRAGDFLHMGKYSHVNIARKVTMGDEVGLGRGTEIYTHGAYLSCWEGFPFQFADVTIGSRVWLPNARVHPGVTIGDDVVVTAMSLVNKDLPSGCLAKGIPAEVYRESWYPLDPKDVDRCEIVARLVDDLQIKIKYEEGKIIFGWKDHGVIFDLGGRKITGKGNSETERLRDHLRRNGIRFRYDYDEGTGEYIPWE